MTGMEPILTAQTHTRTHVCGHKHIHTHTHTHTQTRTGGGNPDDRNGAYTRRTQSATVQHSAKGKRYSGTS
jgi:hypothetical protein